MIRGPTTLKEFVTIYKFCKRDDENEGTGAVPLLSALRPQLSDRLRGSHQEECARAEEQLQTLLVS